MIPEIGSLYLGRISDGDQPVVYPAADLTTHGVIVGMTGSGKTGLGICLIEEALLAGIPCLVIDPKGDMGNLELVFPDLEAADFEPWMDAAAAAKEGQTVEQLAESMASRWRQGLDGSGISAERMRRLSDHSEVTIYTPGSSAGIGLDVLGSMKAPQLDWDSDAEVMRDEIQSLVSSLLTLAGIRSDPMSGPEHILLSTIVETIWRKGKDLDLATLVGQVPNPPFRKLGVFEVNAFIAEKDRRALALKLNGLLASPSFASWMEGVPLDIEEMLGGTSRTKAAVIYMAHLSDEERQFLVTLLLSKMVTWIRSQPGTAELRTLIYMDEVFGFAPPSAEPPSKRPILTILKQARAHGVGMVLSTQNPVDLDYKAMSNAGTWMIGRLQTETDKRRILEGMASAAGGVDLGATSTLITDLAKRQFVMHTTKGAAPVVFGTRWAMSYLAGPLTRDQIEMLTSVDRKNAASTSSEVVTAPADESREVIEDGESLLVSPPVADGVPVVYLDPAAAWGASLGIDLTGTVMEPAVAATVQLLYDDTKAGVNHSEIFEAVVFPIDTELNAGEILNVDHDPRDFLPTPRDGSSYRITDAAIATKSWWSGLEQDLKSHLVANRPIEILSNPDLGLYSRVGETRQGFRERCAAAAEDAADGAIAKLRERFAARIDRVEDQIRTAEERLLTAEQDAAARQQDEVLSGAGDLLGALLGGRSRSNPLGKAASRRAATQKARGKVDLEEGKLDVRHQELVDLEDELAEEIAGITEEFQAKTDNVVEVEIGLEKTDIRVAEMKLVWVPVA